MRATIRTGTRLTICIAGVFIALAGSLLDGWAPVAANGPGVSFSVDLDPVAAGTQVARSVPVGTPFSISIVLDAQDTSSGYLEADVRFAYDDVRLTSPLSGVPLDWVDPPEPGPIGGRAAPWANVDCPPFDAETAIHDEDGVGTANVYVGCYSNVFPQELFTYTGPLWEFVLVCDSPGSAAIDPVGPSFPGDGSKLVDVDFNERFDHVHGATVTCTAGTGDTDADGMPDAYENAHPCLNAAVSDAAANPDVDGKTNAEEYAIGTDPCDNDTDDDGCADGEELGGTAVAGGLRDPLNPWDFYDVNNTKKVDAADIGQVRSRFNGNGPTPPADDPYDRGPGASPWAPGAPDDRINAADIGFVRYAFNHSCQLPP